MPRGGELKIETSNLDLDEACTRNDVSIAPGRYVVLTVSDTGIGMDAKTKERIFEPFFTSKQSGNGTGLGLATVYGIVKQSGGYISVQSQKGKGSSFMIYLPRVEEPETNFVSSNTQIDVLTGTETILLADDANHSENSSVWSWKIAATRFWKRRRARKPRRSGATHNGPINLLFTDVVMPQVDGYQLSDYLRFHRPEMRFSICPDIRVLPVQAQAVSNSAPGYSQNRFCKDALLARCQASLERGPGLKECAGSPTTFDRNRTALFQLKRSVRYASSPDCRR